MARKYLLLRPASVIIKVVEEEKFIAMTKTRNKNKIDMLNGPIWNKIPLFALPVAATAVLEQLFNAADLAVVGNFTTGDPTVAVAAVGANTPVVGLLLNFFIGISLGANVVIANAIGRGDDDTVHKTVHTAVLMALLGGVLTALVGQGIAGWLLGLLNVPADVLPSALVYLRIYLIGMPVIFLYNFEAAIFRSVGETKVPLMALTFAGVLNVVLNLFFVIVLKIGVSGVATATVLSNAVSSAILFYRLTHIDSAIKVTPRALRIHGSCLRKILQIGLPAALQNSVFMIANVVIQSAINSLGTTVIAASSAAFNIEINAYYVVNSFSQACTTFVGQNYGARQLDRCRRTYGLCLLEGAIALGVVAAVVLTFGHGLLGLFSADEQVIALGYYRFQIALFGDIFCMLYEVTSSYLRGYGISLAPALLTMVGVCGIRLSWVFFVFPMYRTFQALLLVFPISLSFTALLIFGVLLWYRPAKRFAE